MSDLISLRGWSHLSRLLLGVVIGCTMMASYLFWVTNTTFGLDALSTFTNVFFTLILIGLYYKMMRVQDKQASLAEIERTPLVEISGYEVDGDDIEIYLSNYGNGTATNLELVTVSHFEADSNLLEPGVSPEPLTKAVEDPLRNYEQSIRPHDERVKFTASPRLAVHRNAQRSGFSIGIPMLDEGDVQDVAFQLWVRYSTRTGNRYTIPLMQMPREINPEEDQTFNDAFTVEGGVKSVPRIIPDPDYPQPPHLSEDAGIPVREDEFDF